MKRGIALAVVLGGVLVGSTSQARLMRAWSYDEMFKGADVVVIARPKAVRQLKERSALPNISTQTAGGKPGPLIANGVETDFEVAVVLKGAIPARQGGGFTLHHYRLPPAPMINGPGLVEFDPTARTQYLMFLARQPDGRYAPMSGQTDPDQAIEPLRLSGP